MLVLAMMSCNYGKLKSTEEKDKNTQPNIYLIGSIHNYHFKSDKNYTISNLFSEIKSLKADLVCGEISPTAYDNIMEGYFPPEATALSVMAQDYSYRFVPCDWRIDYATQDIAYNAKGEDVKKQIKEHKKKLFAKMNSLKEDSFYDVIHDDEVQFMLDSLYEYIIKPNPLAEIGSGSWQERNRRIVENGVKAFGNARNIVFVFGVDHIPQIKRQLEKLGYKSIIPKRNFKLQNNLKLSPKIISKWKKNKQFLEQIRDKKIDCTKDDYDKVMDSNRIKNLEEAISLSI